MVIKNICNRTKKFIPKIRIILLILIFGINFSCNYEACSPNDLFEIKTVLKTKVLNFRSSRYSYIYKFWCEDYPVEFVIPSRRLVKNNTKSMKSLRQGDSIIIHIKKKSKMLLYSNTKRIEVFQMKKDDFSFLLSCGG